MSTKRSQKQKPVTTETVSYENPATEEPFIFEYDESHHAVCLVHCGCIVKVNELCIESSATAEKQGVSYAFCCIPRNRNLRSLLVRLEFIECNTKHLKESPKLVNKRCQIMIKGSNNQNIIKSNIKIIVA